MKGAGYYIKRQPSSSKDGVGPYGLRCLYLGMVTAAIVFFLKKNIGVISLITIEKV